MRRRNRVLVAVVAIILFVSLVIAGYIYTSPPVERRLNLSIVAEDHAIPSIPETGLMILCPNRAREMGLCNIDERQLHAKYKLTVNPPPIARNPTVTCKVILLPEEMKPPKEPTRAMELREVPTIDKSSDFRCSVAPQGEGKYELDLALIGDPDDEQRLASYVLVVTIEYDEPLLSWMPLFTRKVSSADIGDLCLLGFRIGKHPPPGMPESEKPLGEFTSCAVAVFWQRQMLGLEPSCEVSACQLLGAEAGMLSYVTVHVVDAYGKPIQGVTVWLNTTFCCWIDGTYLTWTGSAFSETSDSDGNARFASVIPYARYSVMIDGVVFSEITAPPPSASTTITVTLT